jgi:hypothetical protein
VCRRQGIHPSEEGTMERRDPAANLRRRARRVAGVAFVVALAATSASAAPLDGGLATTLRREPLLTPEAIGDGQVDGLQYADPTEGLALVDPPAQNNGGSAQLSYPLIVPHGRGLTPELALDYDSGAEDGWVGMGWDLSVGEISVDTEFGAPRFLSDKESESYVLDGAMLVPNALGESYAPRNPGDRADYTRKVETEYEQIVRHEVGNGGPDDYYWEVRDKQGNIRWYGGHPDDGGPDGKIRKDKDDHPLTIDRQGRQRRTLAAFRGARRRREHDAVPLRDRSLPPRLRGLVGGHLVYVLRDRALRQPHLLEPDRLHGRRGEVRTQGRPAVPGALPPRVGRPAERSATQGPVDRRQRRVP